MATPDIQAKFDLFEKKYNTDLDNTNAKLKDLTERLEKLNTSQLVAPVEEEVVEPKEVIVEPKEVAEAVVESKEVVPVGGRRRKASRKAKKRKTSRKTSKRR